MKAYRDYVAQEGIGNANREWINMARLALMIREKNNDPAWEEEQRKKFTGIFKRLLEDPIDEVKQAARRR